MSDSQPMAVEAPTLGHPVDVASHAPHVNVPQPKPLSRGKEGMNGNGTAAAARKRSESGSSASEDEKPLAKKPRASMGNGAKKRRIIASSDEDSDAAPAPPKAKPASASSAKPASASAAKPASNTNGKPKASTSRSYSDDSDLSEDDKPLAAKKVNGSNGKTNGKAKKASSASSSASESESDFSDVPIAKKKAAAAKPRSSTASKKPSAKVKKEYTSSEDEKPLAKKAKPAAAKAKEGKKVKKEASSSEDEKPLAKRGKAAAGAKGKVAKAEKEDKKPAVKGSQKKVKEEEEDEDKYKWWEQEEGDGSVKWTTLEHNAVLFPPPYVPLPRDVKMKYDGVALTLPPESEEVAGFYGAMLATDHVEDKTFQANFFRDFKATLNEFPPKENVKVTSLEKCDFKPMYEHFEREREKKKTMTKEEKKAMKDAKDELEKPYLFATVDGRKEKNGNFRAEPPGLFRGRGEHPKKGTLKKRLRPDDIIINIGKESPIPVPNIPGKWKAVTHDNTVTWLAHWKENVNGNAKYVFLSAGSSWKGQSDRAKFEKARELINHVDKIRKDYTIDLKSKITADRQRATALYFIDRLALRAGNEKGEDEADTVGCCSLRYEHVTLEPPNKVIFDFLGKDSMRFHQEVEVDQQVFKNIKIFKAEPKGKGDDLFDRLTTSLLNKYLSDQMKGLTAKVFRTYNASWTFQQQLKNTPAKGSVQEKIAAFNTANREVAILCNHQKTVSKGFAESLAKMGDKVRALKYQRMKLRYQLFTLDPKLKKKRPDLAADESDMDDEFMDRHEDDLYEKAVEAAKKKHDKDNIKLEESGEKKKTKADLEERLEEIKAEFKAMKKERKSKVVESKKAVTEEKLLENIAKIDERIAAAQVQMSDRDKTKDVALGTSKINYIDPRITVAWAKKYDVPLEKVFSKTLREKFPWAEAEADEDWVF